MKESENIIMLPEETIISRIYLIRGKKVTLLAFSQRKRIGFEP